MKGVRDIDNQEEAGKRRGKGNKDGKEENGREWRKQKPKNGRRGNR